MNRIALESTNFTVKSVMSVLLVLSMILFSIFAAAAEQEKGESSVRDFNHMTTGFQLTGQHAALECGACHVGGVFKGTPRNCAGCHSKGRRVVALTMPPNHIVTTDPCELCHNNTATFLGAYYNHGKAQPGACTTCHNGVMQVGKPSNHNNGSMMSTASCDKCHRTFAWVPSAFNHTGVVPGTCTTCHNGSAATGRPSNHNIGIKLTSSCDKCHRFFGWLPTFYDHTGVVPGSCATCHNGSVATGRPSSHTGTKATMSCDSCHTTVAWLPAGFNHAGVVPGTCSTCHEAQRPTSHASKGYTGSCDKCHTTSSWTFNHAAQQGLHLCNNCHKHHHDTTPCDQCHTVNTWNR